MKKTILSKTAVNVQANALARLLDGGFMDVYDGERPESADVPVKDQKLGVTLRFGTPAFTEAENGVLISNPISKGIVVTSINPATWARISTEKRIPIIDVSVGTSNANCILPTVNLPKGVEVGCSAFEHIVSKSTAGS